MGSRSARSVIESPENAKPVHGEMGAAQAGYCSLMAATAAL
ncbi:MAG: hypothetical protein OXG34_06365 [bacterium]|nr:hypothetical protein [bacterium]